MNNLTKCRIGSNCRFKVSLKDSGVSVDWGNVTVRQVFMFSLAQKAFAGLCDFEVSELDSTVLNVTYRAESQMYMGDHRMVIQLKSHDTENTYDALAINIVPLTACVDDDVTIETEAVEIGIEITSIDSGIIGEILEACEVATKHANDAAAYANSLRGMGAVEVDESTESGGKNHVTIKDNKGTEVASFDVLNGKDGKDGLPGADGKDGKDGLPGANGKDGKDGKDYILTDADKKQIADEVDLSGIESEVTELRPKSGRLRGADKW